MFSSVSGGMEKLGWSDSAGGAGWDGAQVEPLNKGSALVGNVFGLALLVGCVIA